MEYKPTSCSYYESDKPHVGVYKQEYGQHVKEGYHPQLSICVVLSEMTASRAETTEFKKDSEMWKWLGT